MLETEVRAAYPKLAGELFLIPDEDRYLVYAPLSRAAFRAGAELVNLIADLQAGEADPADAAVDQLLTLLRRLNLLDEGSPDAAPDAPPITRHSGDPRPTKLSLFLTTACNLRCTYCYAAAGDRPAKAMSLETARRGVDFVIQNAIDGGHDGVEISYHGGGEPTVNWSVLTQSYDYARRRTDAAGLSLTAGVATNGYLSTQQATWCSKHLDRINVSIDGAAQQHDAHRPTAGGGASSPRVLQTLRLFDEAGCSYTVRLTVTDDLIAALPQSVEFLCTHCRPVKIHVEPAFASGRWKQQRSPDAAAFIESYRAAQAVARRHGRQLYASAADIDTLSNHFCGVSQDGFGLTAAGGVSACYEVFAEDSPQADAFLYGHYDRNRGAFEFNLPVLNDLRRQTVDQYDFCAGCFAKWSCGGDCRHRSITAHGGAEFAGSDRCHIVRELTKDQILLRIAQSGGLYWSEPHERSLAAPLIPSEVL